MLASLRIWVGKNLDASGNSTVACPNLKFSSYDLDVPLHQAWPSPASPKQFDEHRHSQQPQEDDVYILSLWFPVLPLKKRKWTGLLKFTIPSLGLYPPSEASLHIFFPFFFFSLLYHFQALLDFQVCIASFTKWELNSHVTVERKVKFPTSI